jgi:Adenylate and Guanylate cyclase catalytic domain
MAELPSGAVTFLFTDIEGSTRLLTQLRERYAEVLAEHQRLLRAAFAAHGRYEVDTQGDSFFVAFSSAREALLAAVEGQLALLSHPWPEGVEIKVRMGLHTGQRSRPTAGIPASPYTAPYGSARPALPGSRRRPPGDVPTAAPGGGAGSGGRGGDPAAALAAPGRGRRRPKV